MHFILDVLSFPLVSTAVLISHSVVLPTAVEVRCPSVLNCRWTQAMDD